MCVCDRSHGDHFDVDVVFGTRKRHGTDTKKNARKHTQTLHYIRLSFGWLTRARCVLIVNDFICLYGLACRIHYMCDNNTTHKLSRSRILTYKHKTDWETRARVRLRSHIVISTHIPPRLASMFERTFRAPRRLELFGIDFWNHIQCQAPESSARRTHRGRQTCDRCHKS